MGAPDAPPDLPPPTAPEAGPAPEVVLPATDEGWPRISGELDGDTLEAYFHLRSHRVAGVAMAPLDIYRCLALEATGSPYTAGRVPSFEDLARAALICSAKDHREVADIVLGACPESGWAARLEGIAAAILGPGEDDPADRLEIAFAQFSAYWDDYYPTYATTVPAGPKGRVQGSLYVRLACFLQTNTNRSRDEAWATAPGEALQELIVISQQNGSKATKIDSREAAIMRALGHDV